MTPQEADDRWPERDEIRAHNIATLDWAKVAAVFKALQWTWVPDDEEVREVLRSGSVPDAERLRKCAEHLRRNAGPGWCASGGMTVYSDGALDFHPSIEALLEKIAAEPTEAAP